MLIKGNLILSNDSYTVIKKMGAREMKSISFSKLVMLNELLNGYHKRNVIPCHF